MKNLALYVVVLILTGCASYEGILSKQSKPALSNGYVAGNFITEQKTFATAFVLTNIETNVEHVLPFSTVAGVEAGNIETNAIAIPPGQYRVTHWMVFNSYWGTGRLTREFKAPTNASEFTKPFSVQANQVVFLGKFSAKSSWTQGYLKSTTRGQWEAQAITFDTAKTIWNKDFPAFSALPLICFSCKS